MLVKTWILKYLRTNETRYIKWQKTCNVNANWMQVFVTTNKDRMKINADVNANNRLTKEYLIKDSIGILAIVNVYAIYYVMLSNI